MVQQREPLSAATLLCLWPALWWLPGLPTAPGSFCVCLLTCTLVCFFVSFCVSDTVVISPVLCWLPVEIQDRACLGADTCPHVISMKLVAQLQRSINYWITESDWKNNNKHEIFPVSTFKWISIWPSCVHWCIALLNFPLSNGNLVGLWFIFI